MALGFRVGELTLLRFRGNDRCRVLNNLCTQDLRRLSHGEARETFVTDGKGRCYGHGVAFALRHSEEVAATESCYFLSVPKQGERLVPHFDRYIIREDATIEDVSQSYDAWLFANSASASSALELSLDLLPGARCAIAASVSGAECLLVQASWLGPGSIVALIPIGSSVSSLIDRVLDRSGDSTLRDSTPEDSVTGDRSQWESQRVAAFWPWYGVDFDERNLPQEVDRNDSAISFNKGCYLGQETIARLDALGQVQKKLVLLSIPSAAHPSSLAIVNDENGKEIGAITSVSPQDRNGFYRAIAMVRRSHFQVGKQVVVGGSLCTVTSADYR
jgi:tRNA-modifying protein YgfZ